MRIAINAQLLSTRVGYRQTGVSRYIARLLAALPAALAPEDELIAFLGRNAELTANASQTGNDSGDRVQRQGTVLPTERPAARILWEQTALPILAVRRRLDLLHGPVNVVPLLARCPTVVTIHDLAYLRLPDRLPSARRRYFAALTAASVRRATRIIAVSESTKADLVELLAVSAERIAVTPLAAEPSFRPVPPEQLAPFLAEQGLVRPFVLYVGTLEPRKNLPNLLRAFDAVAPDIPHDLILVGPDGWLMQEIQTTWRGLAARDRVRFVGFARTEDLPFWYSAADLFAFPSVYEGFGLPPLEAMACGTPVVSSNVSSLPEVVGEAALTVAPDDVEGLTAAIRQVLTDPALAADLRVRGIERARRFSWARTAELTAAVYREVVR